MTRNTATFLENNSQYQ